MNESFIDTIGGVFFLLVGLYSSIFYKRIGRLAVGFQYKIIHRHFNETGFQICFLLGGIIFVILGILTLLRII
jgi:hypothetical protein